MSGTCFFSMTFDMCACSAELSCEKSMFFLGGCTGLVARKNRVARDGRLLVLLVCLGSEKVGCWFHASVRSFVPF